MTNRPLTQKEIDLAPEWATHAHKDEYDDICFESENYYQWLRDGRLRGKREKVCMPAFYSGATPIPRKPFNIESHVFSDSIANIKATNNAGASIVIDAFGKLIDINTQDVIAMTKALGITPEDLK